MATATSRIVRSTRRIAVRRATVGISGVSTKTAVAIN